MYRAELIAQHPAMRLDRDISPASCQPSPRSCLRDGQVLALDDTLAMAARKNVILSSGARLLNAAADLSIVVCADQSALVVLAAAEFALPVPEPEVACIFPNGHILVTAPVIEAPAEEGTDFAFRAGHRVLLISPDTGRVLDEVALDIPDSYLSATQHPVAPVALLTAGEGQDGSRVFAVAEADGRLGVEAVAEGGIAASFNRAGTRLLITPHPSFSPTLRVLNWPDCKRLSSATAAGLGLPDDEMGVCGCYLDDDRVLAMTAEGKLVVLDDGLGLLAEVGLRPAGQGPDFMIGVSPANFAVQTWHDGAASASVWRLPHRH
jgi:hypothetical protein